MASSITHRPRELLIVFMFTPARKWPEHVSLVRPDLANCDRLAVGYPDGPAPLSVMSTLDLALVGNGTIGALVSPEAEIVWICLPRFDGDPVFCSLLTGSAEPKHNGLFAIELIGIVRSEQQYIPDTPVLVTRLFDASGSGIQVTDFAPRVEVGGKVTAPMMLVRRIERIAGNPMIRVRVRPMQHYGAERIAGQSREDNVRYAGDQLALRLTTDASLDAVVNETQFALEGPITFVLGADEDIRGGAGPAGAHLLHATLIWWHQWVASLTIPAEWRNAVVRAAITLALNVVEDTGAVIAAMTTSIPEARDSSRNWDYRYCWLRDAYFVVDALYRLGDKRTTARYVDFVIGIVDRQKDGQLVPVYSATGGTVPEEHEAKHLRGYRDMGPVRIGNQASLQIQHDIYGEVILSAFPLFFDESLSGRGDIALFKRLEKLGTHAANLFDKPDAGLWELRDKERVHTFSSVMCWAACDALARIAARLDLGNRVDYWRARADNIHQVIVDRSWNPRLGAFTAAMNGDTLDASLLLMHPLGFLPADDQRYVGTVRAIGRDLRRGEFIYRYTEKDDFGEPENAFLVCTFWYIDALAAIGELDEARRLFAHVLTYRNRHGLLAEHLDPRTHEQWGNFVQTYSMAGIIDSALRLSRPAD
jgi:GH15 family glucan-1,4-alpha-glucosidase